MRQRHTAILSTATGLFLTLAGLDAVAGGEIPPLRVQAGERLSVVCTILPVWALARDVTEGIEGVEVSLLLESSAGCPHDYAMTTRDRKRLSQANLVLANGLGLERFLKGDDLPRVAEVAAKCRVIRGGDAECRAEEAHGEAAHEQEHHHGGANPHVWLSPAEAITMTRGVGDELAAADPARKDRYAAGVERVVKKLEAVRDETKALAARLRNRKVIAPAGVFDYLARDLDLEIVASFDTHEGGGISTRKLAEIVAKVKGGGVSAILCEAGTSARMAETIAGEIGLAKYELDALATCEKFPPAADWYTSGVRSNLAMIERALSAK